MSGAAYKAAKYDVVHKSLRKRLSPFVASGSARCARCGEPILPSEPWDLGHNDLDPSMWAGPEHRGCNRRAGGRQGNAVQAGRKVSRPW